MRGTRYSLTATDAKPVSIDIPSSFKHIKVHCDVPVVNITCSVRQKDAFRCQNCRHSPCTGRVSGVCYVSPANYELT